MNKMTGVERAEALRNVRMSVQDKQERATAGSIYVGSAEWLAVALELVEAQLNPRTFNVHIVRWKEGHRPRKGGPRWTRKQTQVTRVIPTNQEPRERSLTQEQRAIAFKLAEYVERVLREQVKS